MCKAEGIKVVLPHIKSGAQLYEYANVCVKATQRGEEMKYERLPKLVALLSVCSWKWPGSTPMLIQRWHTKSQSIWSGWGDWPLPLEIIQISCPQPARRFHLSSSRFHFASIVIQQQFSPFSPCPLHRPLLSVWDEPSRPCLHVNTVIVMEGVFWQKGYINEGIMTGEKWHDLALRCHTQRMLLELKEEGKAKGKSRIE